MVKSIKNAISKNRKTDKSKLHNAVTQFFIRKTSAEIFYNSTFSTFGKRNKIGDKGCIIQIDEYIFQGKRKIYNRVR